MKEPVPNPDRQDNLLRPLASEPDPREHALLEDTLEDVRELCDLLRESATDHEDNILPALRQLESRLEALPEALRGTIRQAVDDCLAAGVQETRTTKPSGDASVEEEIAGNRIETAIYMTERNLLNSLDSHGESTLLLFEEAGKRDKEITGPDRENPSSPAVHRQPGLQAQYVHPRGQVAVAHQFVPVLDADADFGCCRDGDRIRIPSDPAIAVFAMGRDERMRPAGGQPWNPRPA